MNMKHFQPSVVSSLLLSLLASISSQPVVDYQPLSDLVIRPMVWNPNIRNPYMRLNPTSYDVYQTTDPNTNYPYFSMFSSIPSGDYSKPDINYETSPIKDNEQRTLIDPEFLNRVYAVMMDKVEANDESRGPRSDRSSNDEDGARSLITSGKQDIDPKLLKEIEASMLEIILEKRGKPEKDNTHNITNSVENNETQKPHFENSAYLLHPAPISLMQTIDQRPFAHPTFQQSNYLAPPSSFSAVLQSSFDTGSQSELPTSTFDHETNTVTNATSSVQENEGQKQYPFNSAYLLHPASMMPMPLMQTAQNAYPTEPMFYHSNFPRPLSYYAAPSSFSSGLPPTTYNSQDQATFYLQPVYTVPLPLAPAPFQIWPMTGQYKPFPDADDSKVLGMNPSEDSSQNLPSGMNEKPVETNLTKINIDPITEKKTSQRLHSSSGGNPREGNEKRINSHSSHRPGKNPSVSGRSSRENESTPLRRNPKPSIPLVRKVVVPINPAEKRSRLLPSLIRNEQVRPQRYKVMYHLQKTYVPIP